MGSMLGTVIHKVASKGECWTCMWKGWIFRWKCWIVRWKGWAWKLNFLILVEGLNMNEMSGFKCFKS